MLDGWAAGHPRLSANASLPHRLLDRWLGSKLLERHRVAPGTLIFQACKARGRDLECRARELLGRPLSQSQRRRQRKRSAIRARSRHRPRAFDGRVLLIRANRACFPDAFEYDPLRGWGPFVSGRIETHDVDCVHRDLLKPPHVDRVARLITAALAVEQSNPAKPCDSGAATSGDLRGQRAPGRQPGAERRPQEIGHEIRRCGNPGRQLDLDQLDSETQ
jgi:hypothetical protein